MAALQPLLFLSFSISLFLLSLPRSVAGEASSSESDLSLDHGDGLYEERFYYNQKLDHFGPGFVATNLAGKRTTYTTFAQRYQVNDTHWGGAASKAPIFLFTGHELGITEFSNDIGFLLQTAAYFKAYVVVVEHRCYGATVFNFDDWDEDADPENSPMRFCSSKQAVEDYAQFIKYLKKDLNAEESPVVAFGGSYAGMLSAWLRLVHPDAIIGALASSAPILQFYSVKNPTPYAYNDIITKDFRTESENCYRVIKNSWSDLSFVWHNEPLGMERIEKELGLCPNLIESIGIDILISFLKHAVNSVATKDYPTPSSFHQKLPAYPVKKICKAIDEDPTLTSGNDTFSGLYHVLNVFLNATGDQKCLKGGSLTQDAIVWGGQACDDMFPLNFCNREDSILYYPAAPCNVTQTMMQCNPFPRPHWTTTDFGTNDVKEVMKQRASNIIFFNGLRDPWSGLGVSESLSDSLPAIIAPEGAHHVDLKFLSKEDPEWLHNIRIQEVGIVSGWLKDYYRQK